MHDEDNAIGLQVSNPSGCTWHCYGDERLLSPVGKDNLDMCHAALCASVKEIYDAYCCCRQEKPEECGKEKEPEALLNPAKEEEEEEEFTGYAAWAFAPILSAVRQPQNQTLKPLFVLKAGQIKRRADIADRRDQRYTTHFWYSSTVVECYDSGLWDWLQPRM